MALLVIKGHASRGKEIIETLKMLGGKTHTVLQGDLMLYGYYIDSKRFINFKHRNECDFDNDIIYSLEQFLAKYPYKLGDKVTIKDGDGKHYIISKMTWNGTLIRYDAFCPEGTSCLYNFQVEKLQPYKEQETMEEKPLLATPTEKEGYYCMTKDQYDSVNIAITEKESKLVFDKHVTPEKVELVLGNDYEVIQKDGKWFVVKKQPKYPNTYEECCKIKQSDPNFYIDTHFYSDKLGVLYKLLICRDAYWKIAGEEMGLDGPWKPDFIDTKEMYYIFYKGYIEKGNQRHPENHILIFPTPEMRNVYYEYFKELIVECKELL